METVVHIFTALMLSLSGLLGVGGEVVESSPGSSELGIHELSPLGPAGGYAMPASGSSGCHFTDAKCGPPEITVTPPIIREGGEVEVCWDPNGRTDCTLMGPFSSAGDGNAAGCKKVVPENDTRFTLICGEDIDSANVRVLPQVQET